VPPFLPAAGTRARQPFCRTHRFPLAAVKADGGSGQLLSWRKQLNGFHFHFVSQNAQGLSPDEEEELAAQTGQQNVFVSVVQETLCEEEVTTVREGCTFVRTPAVRSAARGRASSGLAIVLSRAARRTWADSGELVHRFGSRVLAVRLTVRDSEDKALEVMVVCAYPPTIAAPAAEKDEFLEQLGACIASRRSHEVRMIGGDFNAALGKRRAGEEEQRLRCSALGPWGVERQNAEGDALLELIVEHDLCVAQSFFQRSSIIATDCKQPGVC
jgi:exonuclease III